MTPVEILVAAQELIRDPARGAGEGARMIQAYKASRKQEGSCNACQRRDQDAVLLVSLRPHDGGGLTFRLCGECAYALQIHIKESIEP